MYTYIYTYDIYTHGCTHKSIYATTAVWVYACVSVNCMCVYECVYACDVAPQHQYRQEHCEKVHLHICAHARVFVRV